MDQTATRLRDAKLGSVIEDACGKLPDDCIIDIALENDARRIYLGKVLDL